MGFFGFLFAMIVFTTTLSLGATFVAGRYAIKGVKRLIGWSRGQRLLGGSRLGQETPAQDVVVEPVDEFGAESSHRHGAPVPPDAAHASHAGSSSNRRTHASVSKHDGYVRLNVDEGDTADKVADVMLGYVDDPVLGDRAQVVIDTLDSAEHRRRSLFAELDGTFQRGSISWDRFAAPSQAALESILRNAALLANRIQAFDTAGYMRLFKNVQKDAAGSPRSGADARAERLKLYQDMLAGLDTIQETNESLLLELDKLNSELVGISSAEQLDKDDPILDEIHRLVEEAKYYR